MVEDIFSRPCLVLGCGNPLLGDDGFGPTVIDYLGERLPDSSKVAFIDAGTAVRDILFDLLLAPERPQCLVIVDTGERPGKRPGEVFEIDVDEVMPAKIHDFSLHQFPTTNMLKELKEQTAVDVRIFVVQPEHLPDRVQEGLSRPVEKAVREMAQRIIHLIKEEGYA